MASFHHLLIFPAFAGLFVSVCAQDSMSTPCPSICSAKRRVVQRDCVPFEVLGCSPRQCRLEGGRVGYSCAVATPVPTACPGECMITQGPVFRKCRALSLLRCSVQRCDIPEPPDGLPTRGYACAAPTPTPTACFDKCRTTRPEAAVECRKVVLFGCRISRCAFDSDDIPTKLGFSCSDPLPSPTSCPNACLATRKMARQHCREFAALGCFVRKCPGGTGFICTKSRICPERCGTKGAARAICGVTTSSLGCQVQRCDRGFGERRYACSTPTPTPTACPGVCYGTRSLAKEECTRVERLGLDCEVGTCAGPEGIGFSCGTPVITTDTVIRIDDVTLDQDFKFNLNLKVEEGSGVSQEDFYLLTDATGSMTREISIVRRRFMEIVEARTGVSRNVQFGVGFYRDEADGFDNGFNNLVSITSNITAVDAAIRSLRATGGGDGPEANLVALYRLATNASIGWREGSRRIIVMLGDIPGHEPTCVEGLPELRRDVVVDALNAKEITVVAVSFSPGMDRNTFARGCPRGGMAAGGGQTTFIANGTRGALISSSTGDAISAIEDTVGSLSLRFDSDTSDCDSILTSTYDPPFPIEVEAGSSTVVCQVISLLPGVCEARSSVQCQIRYTASGADMGVLTVRTSNIRGCS